MSGDYVVIGDYSERSQSAGINSQPHSHAWASGAAYAIHLDAPVGNFCGAARRNATGLSATISSSGSVTLADNDFTLHANDLPSNQTGYFLNSRGTGFIQWLGTSNGNLCLGGGEAIGRHNRAWEVRNSGATGSLSLTLDLDNLPGLNTITAGEVWNFQCWFRDPSYTGGSNFTDGLAVRFD